MVQDPLLFPRHALNAENMGQPLVATRRTLPFALPQLMTIQELGETAQSHEPHVGAGIDASVPGVGLIYIYNKTHSKELRDPRVGPTTHETGHWTHWTRH